MKIGRVLLACFLLAAPAFPGSSGGTSGGLPGPGQVTESMLKAIDAAGDEECLTFETGGGGDFEWAPCGSAIADADYGDVVVSSSGAVWTVESVTCTNCLGATEISGGALESEIEAVADLQDFQGAVTDAQVPDNITITGAIGGSTGATDNAILAADGGGGATLQARDLTVSDVAGGVVTLATTAGNALTVDLVEPAAANGASVAGDPLVSSSGDAVASLDTAGAAAGGDYTIRAGDAARNTSGNANGGNVVLDPGSGIGTGTAGRVNITNGGSASAPSLTFAAGTNTGIYGDQNFIQIAIGGNTKLYTQSSGVVVNSTTLTSGGTATSISDFSLLVEANTAGSGAPNVIAVSERLKVFTNEGATAENYHTLPSAVAGYKFTFIVQDADGIRITAAAGDTIRIGSTVSATGGFIRCGTQGGIVHLTSINATEWFAEEHYVTCTVDS